MQKHYFVRMNNCGDSVHCENSVDSHCNCKMNADSVLKGKYA